MPDSGENNATRSEILSKVKGIVFNLLASGEVERAAKSYFAHCPQLISGRPNGRRTCHQAAGPSSRARLVEA